MKQEVFWKVIGGSGAVILLLVAANLWWAQRAVEKAEDTREVVIKLSGQVSALVGVPAEVSNLKERVTVLETRVAIADRRAAIRAKRTATVLAKIKAQNEFMKNYWVVRNP